MIKSVSRSTGLSSVCLIILIIPLVQCSSIGNEESSVGRFKRNTFTDIGSQASAKAEATAGSFVVPLEFLEKGGKPGAWPGAGGPGSWPGAGGKPGGWPGAGGKPGGWPGAGDKSGGWPGAGGQGGWGGKSGGWEGWGAGGWDSKKEGSFGKIISDLVPKLDKTFVPIEKLLTYDALKPFAGIVDGTTSSLFGGLEKGFGGKGGFEKSYAPGMDYSKFFTTYLATGKAENQPEGAAISVE